MEDGLKSRMLVKIRINNAYKCEEILSLKKG